MQIQFLKTLLNRYLQIGQFRWRDSHFLMQLWNESELLREVVIDQHQTCIQLNLIICER
jgi:hypothetical protein